MVIIYPFDIHKVLLFVVFMGICCSVTHAQNTLPDTVELDEITVVATRIQQPIEHQPTNIEFIDSARIAMLWDQNIGQLLSSQSSLFIKESGPGALANVSQRGLSSEQVQILWEGIPINNVMVGQTDLSLLPGGMFSDVQVSSGTPSSAFGGGSLSGALYLSSDLKGKNHLSLQQQVGSYGQWQTMLDGQYQAGRWRVGIRSFVERSENDYEYYNRAYNREEQRQHNRSEKENIMATIARETDSGQIKSMLWFSDSDNQIPGTIINETSEARQKDQALRWLSNYETKLGKTKVSVTNYLDRVELNYFDPEINTRSFSTYRRWMVSADLSLASSANVLWKGEISGALTGVKTNNYLSDHLRRQLSILANPEFTIFNQRLRIYPALRLDAYNDFGTVLSPSLGLNYELLSDAVFLRGQLSRDYNPPTFNALYWGEGGNPNLEPERSKSAEAGMTVTPDAASFSSIKLTAFYSLIDQGIRWYPGNNGVYSPSNVEQIITQGIEANLTNQLGLPGDIRLQLNQSASVTDTRITEPRFSGDAAVGHQMRYVPKWKYNASLSIQKGIANALVQYRWVGRRYTTDTEDIGNSLDPYQVVDATLEVRKEYLGLQFKARAGVRNLLNEDYEVVQWYAMPQRNFTFSLTATYQF